MRAARPTLEVSKDDPTGALVLLGIKNPLCIGRGTQPGEIP